MNNENERKVNALYYASRYSASVEDLLKNAKKIEEYLKCEDENENS